MWFPVRGTAAAVALLVAAVTLGACGRVPAGELPAPVPQGGVPAGGVASATWIGPLVKWGGTIYLLSKEDVDPDRLGEVVGRVTRLLQGEADVQDGDSNFLRVGTTIFAIRGVDPSQAVAAPYKGKYVVLRPGLRPEEIGAP